MEESCKRIMFKKFLSSFSFFFLFLLSLQFWMKISCVRSVSEKDPRDFCGSLPLSISSISLFLRFFEERRGTERKRERERGSINPDRGQLTCSVNLLTMLQVHVIPFQGCFTCLKLPLPLTPKLPLPLTPKYSRFPFTLKRY